MRGDGAPSDFVEANGVRIRYSLAGDPAAPVVLFSNSLATSLEMWDRQAAALAGRYRVLRYDTRGHGLSEAPPGPYDFERLAADARGLLDALGIGHAVFVGLSLGGMIAQVAGATWPDRFPALVLCDTAMTMDAKVWQQRIALVTREGLDPVVEPSLGRWFTPGFAAANPAVMDEMRGIIRQTSVAGFLGCAAAIRDMDLKPTTATIRQPTLVICGADDPSTPPAEARAIQAAIPGATLELIADAAHLPNVQQPAVFNELLGGFLARHAAA